MKPILTFLCSLLLVCTGFAKDKRPNVVTLLVDGLGRRFAFHTILAIFTAFVGLTSTALANPVIYKAAKPVKGKKLVLIASDHEYRSEETIPALARILAKHHGFDCTVLFGLNNKGEIQAGASNIPGLEALKDADGLVIFARFLALPPEQMKHIDDYLNRAGPVLGLRTSTHAFNYKDDQDPYYKYHFRYGGNDYKAGFGHQVLGQTWVGHYGKNHQQSTRITIIPQQAGHAIFRGVKDIHIQCGGYNAKPAKDWTLLTMAQPLMSMEFDGEPDASKPPMVGEWTRTYTGKNGKTGRVFTSLYGASEDILNPGYRRMIINAVYWSIGLEDKIDGGSKIDFLGPYKPNTFGFRKEAKGIKPSAYKGFRSRIPANNNTAAPPRPPKKGRDSKAGKGASNKTPSASGVGKPGKAVMAGRKAPPAKPAPKLVDVPKGYKDKLPFKFQKGDTIAILGNGLADRMQHDGWMETLLQSRLLNKQVTFRNMSLSGDRPNKYPRSNGFTPMTDYLRHIKADVVFAMFGYNESFDGIKKAGDYQKLLVEFVKKTRGSKANGKTIPRIVLFSPIAHENLNDPNLPNGKANNRRLAAYAKATESAALVTGVAYVDLFNPSRKLYANSDEPLTINGVHLNAEGNRRLSEVIAKALLKKDVSASASLEGLREAVLDKNWHWHNRYRATDGNDVWGGRSKLKFVNDQTNAEVLQHELSMLDKMTANRDQLIWARSTGKNINVDDSNVAQPIKVISNVGGGSRSSNATKEGDINYVSGAEGVKKMAVSPGFELNLFADEKQFPELVNPVQMQVDTKGRLWVAAWQTYPKWEPLKEMKDALLILPDDDGDGKADRVIEFARVHNPLGFEFWNGGVIVTSMPDIIFLKDTDGDDVADVRYVLFSGLGSSDTHHSANNMIYGPDGGIYWQSGIFLQHNHEHPWGPAMAAKQSGMYRFDPRRHTIAFHGFNGPNPHGISFDYWGYHYATDGTGGRAYQVRPQGKGWKMHHFLTKEVRPVCANEIISSTHFPDEMQGNFLILNAIGFLGIKQYSLNIEGGLKQTRIEGKRDKQKTIEWVTKFGEAWGTPNGGDLKVTKTMPDGTKIVEESKGLMMSGDKNFRPTDAIFGQDGALYISDWHNAIIGHMQHNVRDPNRDHQHGRIYRLTAKGRPLQKPVKIDGQPIAALLDNLKHPVNGVRHRTHIELSERDSKEVIAATKKWMKQFDRNKTEDAHHLLEALWIHQQHNVRNTDLLNDLLKSPEPHARVAAQTVNHHWFTADPATGAGQIEEEIIEVVQKSGILSDTKDLTTIRIATVVEKMKYDTPEITVKAGKKIKLIFANPDFMPHNIVMVKPGTDKAVVMQAMMLGANGFAVGFVPKSDDILWSSKLLDHGKEQVIEFTAPAEPGDYPLVCTFPGHSLLMRSTLHVK